MVDKDSSRHGIGKFDGIDFAFWRMQIEGYLYGKKLHLPLLRAKPERMLGGDWVP